MRKVSRKDAILAVSRLCPAVGAVQPISLAPEHVLGLAARAQVQGMFQTLRPVPTPVRDRGEGLALIGVFPQVPCKKLVDLLSAHSFQCFPGIGVDYPAGCAPGTDALSPARQGKISALDPAGHQPRAHAAQQAAGRRVDRTGLSAEGGVAFGKQTDIAPGLQPPQDAQRSACVCCALLLGNDSGQAQQHKGQQAVLHEAVAHHKAERCLKNLGYKNKIQLRYMVGDHHIRPWEIRLRVGSQRKAPAEKEQGDRTRQTVKQILQCFVAFYALCHYYAPPSQAVEIVRRDRLPNSPACARRCKLMAARRPSTAADMMPPARPAPSPAGNRPDRLDCPS